MKNKKYDKVLIVGGIFLLFALMSWFIAAGSYTSGEYVSSGLLRIGLFDVLILLTYALTYGAFDIVYLFMIGGVYGVLSACTSYRKLVSKTVHFIKGKEYITMLVVTFLMGLYTSFSNHVLSLLWVAPFIVTVFLKRGENRLTALSAAFGGLFIGYIGQTVGTYGVSTLLNTFELTVTSGIVFKIILFLFTYALFNTFAILHMKNSEKVNELKYDMFATEKVDEKEIPIRKRRKIWPTVVVLGISLIISFLAYISWSDSFQVTLFDQFFTSISNVKISDISIINSAIGSFNAFGKWSDLIQLGFVLFIASIFIALLNKMSLHDFIDHFALGMKKIGKIAFIYLLVYGIYTLVTYFPWGNTVLNAYLGSGHFNVFTILLFGFVAAFFLLDLELIATSVASFFSIHFADHLLASSLLLHTGFAIGQILLPTSFVLMIALTYLDVPYKDWLKYIWKFVLSLVAVAILMFAIMCYM